MSYIFSIISNVSSDKEILFFMIRAVVFWETMGAYPDANKNIISENRKAGHQNCFGAYPERTLHLSDSFKTWTARSAVNKFNVPAHPKQVGDSEKLAMLDVFQGKGYAPQLVNLVFLNERLKAD
jgi:hypothetical protein